MLDISGTYASTLGQNNPIRYRGYYYDSETSLYYLNSRYYDPAMRRFINADDIDFLGADEGLLGYNLFAYCLNDPVNRTDDSGNLSIKNWIKIGVGAIALGAAIALTVATGGGAAAVAIGVAKVVGSVALSTATSAGIGYLTNGKEGAIDGACNGFMWGSIVAAGSAATNALQTIGKIPKKVKVSSLVDNPTDPYTTIGPKQGAVVEKINQIQRLGKYEYPSVKSIGSGLYEIQNGHHTVQALRSLGIKTAKVWLVK